MNTALNWLADRHRHAAEALIEPEPFDVDVHGSPELRGLVSIPAELLTDAQKIAIETAHAWERNVHPRPQQIADLCNDLSHLVPDEDGDWDDPAGPFKRRGN